MRRAWVTGAAGFIGSHLTERLLDMAWDVVPIDNLSGGWADNLTEPERLHVVDITDQPALEALWEQQPPDVVFHYAAYAALGLSHWARRFNYEQNLIGSINLINLAIRYGVDRFVFASSESVYRDTGHRGLPKPQPGQQSYIIPNRHSSPPFLETVMPEPTDPYAIAKYAVELDLMAAADVCDMDFCIIRPHNVYGENQNLGDPYRNVVAIFMRQAMNGEPMTIFNDGEQVRAYSYIGDLIDPMIRAATHPGARNQIFNIGGEERTTVNELAALIQQHFPKATIEYVGDRHEARRTFANHHKARSILGFDPAVPLEEGIHRMAEWAVTVPVRWSRTPTLEHRVNLPAYWSRHGTPNEVDA